MPRLYAQLRVYGMPNAPTYRFFQYNTIQYPVDTNGKSHTPAPNTEGVTEMEGLGRANLAKDGKKRKYEYSPARSMPESE